MKSKPNNPQTQKPADPAMPPLTLFPPPNPEVFAPAVLPVLNNAIIQIEKIFGDFWAQLNMETNLTGQQRKRFFSVKSRNYGFINKAYAIAQENPNFVPLNFSLANMTKNLEVLERARQLTLVIEQIRAADDDFLLMTCDTAYRDALRIYGNLREQRRARVAGANALFQELLQFFTLRRRRPGEAEPTEHELEVDFRRLIHGHADGEMVIKNESPHISGAVHEVVDDMHKRGKHGAEIRVKEEE